MEEYLIELHKFTSKIFLEPDEYISRFVNLGAFDEIRLYCRAVAAFLL